MQGPVGSLVQSRELNLGLPNTQPVPSLQDLSLMLTWALFLELIMQRYTATPLECPIPFNMPILSISRSESQGFTKTESTSSGSNLDVLNQKKHPLELHGLRIWVHVCVILCITFLNVPCTLQGGNLQTVYDKNATYFPQLF